MRPLKRSAFATHLFLNLGALLGLALGTLHFETAGGAVGASTPVAVTLILLLALRILWVSFARARDAGASAWGALLAMLASMMLVPFVTLALLFLPSAPTQSAQSEGATSPAWQVVLSLPLGAVAGVTLLLLVRAFLEAF